MRTARPISRCPPAGQCTSRPWTPTAGWCRACGRSCRPRRARRGRASAATSTSSAPPTPEVGVREVLMREPAKLRPESRGAAATSTIPSMVQPVLDKHCVSCHGGAKDIAAGLDLSGGWTEHFSISYENLANRRETQLVAYWIAGIDCMNGTALWSAQIFPPRGPRLGHCAAGRNLDERPQGLHPQSDPDRARSAAGVDRHQRPVSRHVGLQQERLRDKRLERHQGVGHGGRCSRPAA